MKKKLPIGISDFRNVIEGNYYYIDKTMFIKDIVDSSANIILLPRPRRFGKTLNLSMLKYYYDCIIKDSKPLFKDSAIWKTADKYKEAQGKNPVIFLTFKDIKQENWESCLNTLKKTISFEVKKHSYLLKSNKIDSKEKKEINKLIDETASTVDFESSLKVLTKCLKAYHNSKPVLLLDEYDTPVYTGYTNNYYDKIILFMRNLLSGALKENDEFLEKGVITGTLRIAKESIFTGLNNLEVHSILSYYFSNWFGFTEAEISNILSDYGLNNKFNDISYWYNGYIFGDKTIYNPWSILSYINNPSNGYKTYWINTSSNELIRNLITEGGSDLKADIAALINEETITREIDENIVLRDIEKYNEAVWSLLLFSGYLKNKETIIGTDGGVSANVMQIPNNEVKKYYKSVITKWMAEINRRRKA